jgi:hypothetical protein
MSIEASHKYQDMIRKLLLDRESTSFSQDDEWHYVAQLDDLWQQMTEEEQDEAERFVSGTVTLKQKMVGESNGN